MFRVPISVTPTLSPMTPLHPILRCSNTLPSFRLPAEVKSTEAEFVSLPNSTSCLSASRSGVRYMVGPLANCLPQDEPQSTSTLATFLDEGSAGAALHITSSSTTTSISN